ncbi:MAG: hypothetical protein NWR42_08470, partial [Desulfobacterales bacterium]|nr:hypothetical protein [Desulfobacterales bacterium]
VEQAVLGVDVKVDKFGRVYCLHGVLTALMALGKRLRAAGYGLRVTGSEFQVSSFEFLFAS